MRMRGLAQAAPEGSTLLGRAKGLGGCVAVEIIARQRHRILAAGQLELEDALVIVPEGMFASLQVIAPHAAKAVIIKRAGAVRVRGEAVMPMAQRFGVVQPPHLQIGGVKLRDLDCGGLFSI